MEAYFSSNKQAPEDAAFGTFAQTSMLQLVAAVTTGLSGGQEETGSAALKSWAHVVLGILIRHFFSKDGTFAWAKSQQFSQALFSVIFECLKRDNSGVSC